MADKIIMCLIDNHDIAIHEGQMALTPQYYNLLLITL